MKRKAAFLVVSVGNHGNTDATSPVVAVGMQFEKQKSGWNPAMFNERQLTSKLEFKGTLVESNSGFDAISDKECAYSLITNGLEKVGLIISKASENFVIAFAFEGKTKFYFASDNVVELPLGGGIKVGLSAHSSNSPSDTLSYDYDFLLVALKWDELYFVPSEEELPVGVIPMTQRQDDAK